MDEMSQGDKNIMKYKDGVAFVETDAELKEFARNARKKAGESNSSGKKLLVNITAIFWKTIAVLAKFAKMAKLVKIGMAATTFAAYAWIFSWKFALVLMFMVGFHECGHLWAMRRLGMKTKGFYFVPFFGGAAIPDDAFPSRGGEVFVAIMGPIWGALLSLVAAIVAIAANSPVIAGVASFWAFINFFNLLPINPMDGGRIIKSIAFSIHSVLGIVFLIAAFIGGIVFSVYYGYALLTLLAVLGGFELAGEMIPEKFRKNRLRKMSISTSVISSISFIALAVSLFAIMHEAGKFPGANIALELLKS